MIFASIDNAITHKTAEAAIKRFSLLLLELGVRKNNEHVGTGLGGNNFQLVVLMSMKHHLVVKSDRGITIADRVMSWQVSWLRDASMTHVRETLDRAFLEIMETHKLEALAYEALAKSHNLLDTVIEHKESFPHLIDCLNGKYFDYDPKLSNLQHLVQAYVMCQDLAKRLDNGDESTMWSVGAALENYPNEIILLAVRRYIQIDRLVRHNMDEDPVFAKMLSRINNLVQEI